MNASAAHVKERPYSERVLEDGGKLPEESIATFVRRKLIPSTASYSQETREIEEVEDGEIVE